MRCRHLIERSVVKCEVCDARELRPLSGEHHGGKRAQDAPIIPGSMMAGARILGRAPVVNKDARWKCACECGDSFIEVAHVLREKEAEGRIASCVTCRWKHRKPRATNPDRKPVAVGQPRPERIGVSNPNLKFRPIPAEHAIVELQPRGDGGQLTAEKEAG